jgi:hypothetical protein
MTTNCMPVAYWLDANDKISSSVKISQLVTSPFDNFVSIAINPWVAY